MVEVIRMDQKTRVEFKERLKAVMELKGIRAVDIVENTDIPKGAISYYISGKSQPKADRLYILAKYLNVSEAWLLGYDVPMERTAEQKKNDDLVKIIAQMRKDPKFFGIVSMLAELPSEQYDSLTTIISALGKK
jgi:transcriptional regulator with XRE-family HTH domain